MASKLAHQHVARLLATDAQGAQGESTDPALVGQGMMKLYSFYEPSLVGGDYWIDAFQSISVTGVDNKIQSKNVINYNSSDLPKPLPDPLPDPSTRVRQMQRFEVVQPQFSIPLEDITTHYPPDGHQDEGRVLPHVVLSDPHLPWERYPGREPPFNGPQSNNRESAPWLAVVVFDPEELLLAADEITTLGIPTMPIISVDGTAASPTKVPPSGAYAMSVQEYLKIDRFSRVDYDDDPLFAEELQTSQEATKVIFPTKDLFAQLFGTKDKSYMAQYTGLAHVRNINTTGMPDAGVEETGLFSLVVSRRTGPPNLTTPKTQMAHLISIEHFDDTIARTDNSTPTSKTNRIGLVSLFSWTYTALPPNPVNFLDSMINIGNTTQLMKPDQGIIDGLTTANPPKPKLIKRLDSGYIFSRWRVQTGEETVAFNRGPLVPAPVTSPTTDNSKIKWPGSSNYGTDYQILDTDLGVMDVSYSSAWQLGKTLAIGDRVFCGALMRFRGLVHSNAASETRTTVSTMQTKDQLLASISSHIDKLVDLSKGSPNTPVRLAAPRNRTVTAGINDPVAQPTLQDNILKEAQNQMKAQDLTAPGGIGNDLYNGFNKPVNSDWAVILNWITGKLYLDGIPSQHLIVDPSHLPMERIRFFHIDPNWLDCLIDGALSACNHADRDDDIIRKAIKDGYNAYLKQVLPSTTHTPQTPRFGFILRSAVVKAFPGLHIDIPFPDGTDLRKETRATICDLTALNDSTIMCLLDRGPEELQSITITQPPHQQRFSLGENIDPKTNTVEFSIMDLYTDSTKVPQGVPWPRTDPSHLIKDPNVYNATTRCFDVEILKNIIKANMKPENYNDLIVTSLPIALELNDPCYFLKYKNAAAKYIPQTPHQLWSGPTISPPAQTTPTPSKPLPSASPSVPTAQPPSVPTETPVPSLPPSLEPTHTTTPTPIAHGPAVAGTPRLQYTLSIYPDYLPNPLYASSPDYVIPTHNTYLMDLIFSLRRVNLPSASDNFFLSSIVIDLPLSSPDPKIAPKPKDPESLLLYPYTGPGARMLSNLRFTISLNRPVDTNILQLVLVPRGKTAITMHDTRLMDLSFKLSQCAIGPIIHPANVSYPRGNGWKPGTVNGLGTVKIVWREGYTYDVKGQVGFVQSDGVTIFKKDEGSDDF